MEIRRLTEADVPAAVGLSTQAGWNQIEADWRRLRTLAPDRCFAGCVDGEVVATATVVTYETGGSWVGMVLVDEDHRRQGYGTRMLEWAIEATPAARGAEIGLDATDQGRPLYREYGFESVCDISRLSGTIRPDAPAETVDTVTGGELDGLAAYDEAACGTDRAALLDALLAEDGTTGFVSRGDAGPEGYAVLRPGRTRWHLGPVVADDVSVLATLLDAAGGRLDGEPVFVDSLASGERADLLAARGLAPRRELTRMTYPDAAPLLTGDAVVAAAGFELG